MDLENLMGTMLLMVGVFLLFAIALYIISALVMIRYNKIKYGKKTPMAWLPFANIY